MKKPRRRPGNRWPQYAMVAALLAPIVARPQSLLVPRRVEDPKMFKLHITDAYAGVFSEGRFEDETIDGRTVTHDRLFIGPLFGLSADGSVYHPNLFRFVINGETAVGNTWDTIDNGRRENSRNQFEHLGRISATGDFLAQKPFRSTIFGDFDHSYRDYDFFNRVTVDSTRYGVKVGYDKGPLPIAATYTHLDEEVTAGTVDTTSRQDVLNLNARHDRQRGNSTFNYTFDQYTRSDFGRVAEGNNHTVALADAERFGANDRVHLFSNLSYSRRDDFEKSEEIVANADLNAEHSRTLSSFYDVSYDNYRTEDYDSSSYIGRAELRHQLFSSLTSSLILQAADYEASDSASDAYTRRYGGGIAEVYTKSLGLDHRVRLSELFFVERFDQHFDGPEITVKNEAHSFSERTSGDGFILNLPDVQWMTVFITDTSDTPPGFVRGVDYELQQNGERTFVIRLPGSRIGPNDRVLVDYEAEAPGSGQYETFTETAQIRFDLFKNLWGIYARLMWAQNNADRDLRIQNIMSYAAGSDVSWHWFRGGAEYEVYDADFSHYNSARLFQSGTFRLDDSSTLNVDFSQTFTDYEDADRQEEDYRFITRYHQNLPRARLDIEGGIDLRRGEGVDRTLATVRPGIEWTLGRTAFKAGYDFEYDLFLEREERTKHLFFFRAKRSF